MTGIHWSCHKTISRIQLGIQIILCKAEVFCVAICRVSSTLKIKTLEPFTINKTFFLFFTFCIGIENNFRVVRQAAFLLNECSINSTFLKADVRSKTKPCRENNETP